MLLRAATTADLTDLVAVQEEGARTGLAHIFPQDTHPFPRAAIRARWESELADPGTDVLVVVRRPGTIDGFAAVRRDQLLHFGTAVETWGTGLAAAVHDELLDRLARAGAPTAWLRVFAENHRARRFYQKMGWVPTGRQTRSSYPPHPVLVDYEIGLGAVRRS